MYAGDIWVKFLGPPARNTEFCRGGDTYEVFKWNTHPPFELVVYAAFDREERSLSVVVLARRAEDAIVRELAWVQRYVALAPSGPVLAGDTLTLASPLWPGTDMRGFTFASPTRALAEILPLDSAHASGVHILQAIPVHPSEVDLQVQYGHERLVELLTAQDAYLDLARSPVG